MTANFSKLFGSTKMIIIGMIHLKALPGTPLHKHGMEQLVKLAREEAEIYKAAKVDGVLIENMWDLPYVQSQFLGPEIVASMTRIASEVRKVLPSSIPCGIQILAGGNKEALAVSHAVDLQFIRAESFVFSHVADEGWMDATAGELLRYRKSIGCEHIQIYSDIKKKHSAHAVTSDVTTVETAKAAEFFLADGVIITGSATGHEADPSEVASVVKAVTLPVFLGSGITSENIYKFENAAGAIVGSFFKKSGVWSNELEIEKIVQLMDSVKKLRNKITE